MFSSFAHISKSMLVVMFMQQQPPPFVIEYEEL